MDDASNDTEANIYSIVQTDISKEISKQAVARTLSSEPFISIPDSFNSRDLNASPYHRAPIRPRCIYRSGTLENIGADGIQAIRNLNIRTIFDLRSYMETEQHPDPRIDGVEIVWIPSTWDNETTVQAQKAKEDAINRPFSLVRMYLELMQSHKTIFKAVLQHVRDHPGEPFMFHCTAGKDRTGVLSFLLLSLAGADLETLVLDHALTRVAIEPVKEYLLMKLSGGLPMEEIFQNEKLKQYADIPLSTMRELNQAVEEQYGGVESYVRNVLDFSDKDIERIKRSLTGDGQINGVKI